MHPWEYLTESPHDRTEPVSTPSSENHSRDLRTGESTEQCISSFVDEVSIPFCMARTDGSFVRANDAYAQLTGYTAEELLSDVNWSDTLTPPEWREQETAHLNRLIETGQPQRYEKQYRRKSGEIIDVELLVHLGTSDGRDTVLYAFVQDVSEGKRIKRELEHAASFPEMNPNPVLEISDTQELLYANDAARSLLSELGLDHGENPAAAGVRAAMASMGPGTTRHMSVRFDDRTFRVTLVRKPSSTVMYAMDTSDEALAWAMLREEEERFRATFEHAPVGIAHIGLDGTWLLTNQGLRDFLGYTEAELCELTFADITHPDDLVSDLQQARRLYDGSIESYTIEKRYRRKDGSYVWALLSGSAVRDKDGEPRYFVAVIEDISERKAAHEREAEELEATNLVLSAVGSLAQELELDRVCATLATIIAGLVGRSRVVIDLYEATTGTLTVAAALNARSKPGTALSLESLPRAYGRVIQERCSLILDYATDEFSAEEKEMAARFNTMLGLAVPIVDGDRTVGIIAVDEPGEGEPFTERQVGLVERIAQQAAVAIKNAEEYGREYEVARTLQEALLALPDTIEGVEFEALYRAASDRARVGGDFIDIFRLPDGKICFCLGDVSGKGLAAAGITAAVRNIIRAHALSHESPATVLSKTNEALCHFTEPESFVTGFLGMLNLENGELVYANGGHPSAIAFGPDGDTRVLDGADPVLGAFREAEYRDRVFFMPPGWSVFAFSDGVTETRRDGELFGEERVRKLVGRTSPATAAHIVAAVFDALSEYSGGHFADDIAMLAVHPLEGE